MAKLLLIVLLVALACGPAAIYAAEEPAADDAIVTPVIPDDSTTTTKSPDTTTKPTTTTTEPTTTTTTEPTTTTTTEPTTTTSSTTTAPITTTPAPKPVGPPESNHWTVKNDTKFCLIVDMAIQLNLTYKISGDGAVNYTLYDVPVNKTQAEGKCTSNVSEVAVKWDQGQLALEFGMAARVYNLTHFIISLNVLENSSGFPGAVNQTIELIVLAENIMTPQGMSYHCGRAQAFNATQKIDGTPVEKQAQVMLSKVAWQAFHDRAADGYDLAKDCDANDTPDIVPIAVGLALAGLVVIVLLGYLVGRRRSSNRGGYLSM